MTLEEIISSVSWSQLKASLLWLRADIEPDPREYQKVFRRLKTLTPVVENMRIYIEKRLAQEENENDGFDVCGRDGTLNRELDDFQYLGAHATEEHGAKEVVWSLCLKPWVNWLGMEIANETVRSFSSAEIAAHCLWEMTFHGYVENDVKEFSAELDRRVAELDAMTEEEKASKLLPLDEVIARVRTKIEDQS
jgi:hypothetical protein